MNKQQRLREVGDSNIDVMYIAEHMRLMKLYRPVTVQLRLLVLLLHASLLC